MEISVDTQCHYWTSSGPARASALNYLQSGTRFRLAVLSAAMVPLGGATMYKYSDAKRAKRSEESKSITYTHAHTHERSEPLGMVAVLDTEDLNTAAC